MTTNLRTQYNCHILEALLHCIQITVYTTVRMLGSLDDRYISHTAVSSQRISEIGITDKYTLIIYSTQWIITILFQISRNYLSYFDSTFQSIRTGIQIFRPDNDRDSSSIPEISSALELFRPLGTLPRRCLASPLPTPSYLVTAENLLGLITN